MEDKKYNGWTNYETWVTKLWMDNDEGSYNYWKERAQEVYTEAKPRFSWETQKTAAMGILAKILEEDHEEGAQSMLRLASKTTNVYDDLLNAALSAVNWYEIAEHLIEDHCGEAQVQEKTSE